MLTAGMLLYPKQSLYFALTGLTLWFEKMIPALLPFMILSGLLIGLNLTDSFVAFLKPVLGRLFHLNGHGVYTLFIGFLCGFPMGARVTADLYKAGRLTKEEAQLLLNFCNNIGPIYFTGFVLLTLKAKKTLPFLFGMYGLPFFYGLFLSRLLLFKKSVCKASVLYAASEASKPAPGLLDLLDDAIMSGLSGITRLGGYMILFNLLNLLPYMLLHQNTALYVWSEAHKLNVQFILYALNCLLEITSGISRIGNSCPLLVLTLLPFGGFSCIAQTYSMIKGTGLSIGAYVFHKLVLTAVSGVYYVLLFHFAAGLF